MAKSDVEVIGAKITNIRKMTSKELDIAGLDYPTSIIELDNGTKIFALRDEEGNGPGILIGMKGKLQVYLGME